AGNQSPGRRPTRCALLDPFRAELADSGVAHLRYGAHLGKTRRPSQDMGGKGACRAGSPADRLPASVVVEPDLDARAGRFAAGAEPAVRGLSDPRLLPVPSGRGG